MAVIGYFDLIDKNHAIGWAFEPAQLSSRLTIEIIVGETVVATGIADKLHGGLIKENVGDGYYGFAIPLPNYLDVDSSVLKAREIKSGTFLNGAHLYSPMPITRIVGNVDGIIDCLIFGWVVSLDLELPKIEVQIEGKKIGFTQIGAARSDIVSQGIAEKAYSYYFDLCPFLKGKEILNKTITLIHTPSLQVIAGTPLKLGEHLIWSHVEPIDGIVLNGWVTFAYQVNKKFASIELVIDGDLVSETISNLRRKDFELLGVSNANCGFKIAIPARYLDGKKHELLLREKDSQQILNNSRQSFTLTLCHKINYANASVINGWMFIEECPSKSLSLEAWEDDNRISKAVANQKYPAPEITEQTKFGIDSVGFSLNFADSKNTNRRIRISLTGDNKSATGHDILIHSRAEFIRQMEKVAQVNPISRWWIQDCIAQLRHSDTPDGTLYKEIPVSSTELVKTVDIIIPVYKGRSETLACIQSVIDNVDDWLHEIIVINDASPDARLSADLQGLAKSKRITLLENKKNLGFVATVNLGMKLHPDRDVILLNSDTVVPTADWISRLRRAAYNETYTATVTPFSNRATICSFPSPQVDNDLPNDLSVTELDQIFSNNNADVQVDIPTAIGFCMFIKREALNEVGFFDEERWAKGYCEENDFCIRAASIGWKHVNACDVFVQHHGSVSFQGEKQARVEENLKLLNSIYPDYAETVTHFIQQDSLSEARGNVTVQLMKYVAKKHILHITHAWGGGIEHHVNQLCLQSTKNKSHLILRPTIDGRIEILQFCSGLTLSFSKNELKTLFKANSIFISFLRELGVISVHLHQWIGLPATVWDIAHALNVPFDYTVHDYYAACPRIHLLDYTGNFCDQAPIKRCEFCVKAKPLESPLIDISFKELGGTVATWRNFHQSKFDDARQVVAPCNDAAERIQRVFSLKKVVVKPHEDLIAFKPKPLPKKGEQLRVAVIGAIGPNKGYDSLLNLVQLAEDKAPHIQFVIVGYTMDDTPFEQLNNVKITGKYAPDELQPLLEKYDCHVALFLSPWCETYSYTLSEALKAGITPVSFNIGALAERMTHLNSKIVLNENTTTLQICEILQTISNKD
jgi:GT2 family glycosyltransferase/glycosyltransferase involved in cell wall biosynthesis